MAPTHAPRGTSAVVALVIAIIAAGFAWYQGWVARDAEKRSLRAYVFIEKADFNVKDHTLIAVLSVENSGQTPAYDFEMWQRMQTQPATDEFSYLPTSSKAPKIDKSIIGPGTTVVPQATLDVPADNQAVYSLI